MRSSQAESAEGERQAGRPARPVRGCSAGGTPRGHRRCPSPAAGRRSAAPPACGRSRGRRRARSPPACRYAAPTGSRPRPRASPRPGLRRCRARPARSPPPPQLARARPRSELPKGTGHVRTHPPGSRHRSELRPTPRRPAPALPKAAVPRRGRRRSPRTRPAPARRAVGPRGQHAGGAGSDRCRRRVSSASAASAKSWGPAGRRREQTGDRRHHDQGPADRRPVAAGVARPGAPAGTIPATAAPARAAATKVEVTARPARRVRREPGPGAGNRRRRSARR